MNQDFNGVSEVNLTSETNVLFTKLTTEETPYWLNGDNAD